MKKESKGYYPFCGKALYKFLRKDADNNELRRSEYMKHSMDEIDTCDLVAELVQRDAVQRIFIEPYEPLSVDDAEIDEGPCQILVIWD